MNNMKEIIVKTEIKATSEDVWQLWTQPEHIVNWNFATDEWRCPGAVNEIYPGGRFSWRMEAKDGSMGFDFCGEYIDVLEQSLIKKKLDDNRIVKIEFVAKNGSTQIIQTFEADDNDPELQRKGWQAILDNFKKYVESSKRTS